MKYTNILRKHKIAGNAHVVVLGLFRAGIIVTEFEYIILKLVLWEPFTASNVREHSTSPLDVAFQCYLEAPGPHPPPPPPPAASLETGF